MADILPSQIDYTSRDYLSLRADLLSRVSAAVPEWSAGNASDFGTVLVESFAHLGDVLSYYIDRAANESSLSTATRRASVLALSRDLGYEPSGYRAAVVDITFSNASAGTVTIPAGTVVTASVEQGDYLLHIPFETNADVTIAAATAGTISATQGQTHYGSGLYGESIGVSSGATSQFFRLPNTTVVKESVILYVYDGVNFTPWTRVDRLADTTPTSRVFRVVDDGYGGSFVEFGDGVAGAIPSMGYVIYAIFRSVNGTNGNVAANTITELTSVPGLSSGAVITLSGTISVTNESAATGGGNPEDLQSIRTNAAKAYRASNRAVTLEDYQNIALLTPACGKASAQSVVPSSVILTVAPARNAGAAEAQPGYIDTSGIGDGPWEPTTEYLALQTAVKASVESKMLAGVALTLTDVVYSQITIEISVTSLPSVLDADVTSICKQGLADRLEYSAVGFGASITTSDLTAFIASLGVTESVTIDNLKRSLDGDAVNNLQAADDEIFLLPELNITVTATGGAA